MRFIDGVLQRVASGDVSPVLFAIGLVAGALLLAAIAATALDMFLDYAEADDDAR